MLLSNIVSRITSAFDVSESTARTRETASTGVKAATAAV